MTSYTSQPDFAGTADFYRVDASLKLDPQRRAELGQYMTPASIGQFMASLFSDISGDLRVLDPGAGIGSLTAALVERLCASVPRPRAVSLVCYEIEPLLLDYLSITLEESEARLKAANIGPNSYVHTEDFILNHSAGLQTDLFQDKRQGFTHVIMNPPYKKIRSKSEHRIALRKAGLETSNLYTGFMFLAAQQLKSGGEMVAIVPRSFCNGAYFKPFRKEFFSAMGLQQIHIFEKRNAAFRGDDVLQENIIIHAVKDARPERVKITASNGAGFQPDSESGDWIADDMTQRVMDYVSVIRPNDPNRFVHITTNAYDQGIAESMAHFSTDLSGLGLEISTGPVVDFRLRHLLRSQPDAGTAPLLYPAHFPITKLEWPKLMKKPNAICVTEESRKWLWPNQGHFVVTKRFTSKEERRRIVASIYKSDLPGELVGFENHLNVYHVNRIGLSQHLAAGLSVYLNSSLVDRYFRQFNGHTQVNATDLRSLRYPERNVLERIGEETLGAELSQQEIDNIIATELAV